MGHDIHTRLWGTYLNNDDLQAILRKEAANCRYGEITDFPAFMEELCEKLESLKED
jgi:hypothetical protein